MSVESILKNRIKKSGPILVDEFIQTLLYDDKYGYYKTKTAIGSGGDFVTAPEISQLFGEMIGVWCLYTWQMMGAPKVVRIVECGAGHGTLLSDALRIFKTQPAFFDALQICIIDCSPALTSIQKEKLKEYTDKVIWYSHVDDLPEPPNGSCQLFICNEFFDAFPIKQFINDQEQHITLNDQDEFSFLLKDKENVHETCPMGDEYFSKILDQMAQSKSAAVIIDYGDEPDRHTGNTLQCLFKHKYCALFDHMGSADITHHVNFRDMNNLIPKGFKTPPLMTQREFLKSLGIEQRAQNLIQQNPSRAGDVAIQLNRLIGNAHMGKLFKVMQILKEG